MTVQIAQAKLTALKIELRQAENTAEEATAKQIVLKVQIAALEPLAVEPEPVKAVPAPQAAVPAPQPVN